MEMSKKKKNQKMEPETNNEETIKIDEENIEVVDVDEKEDIEDKEVEATEEDILKKEIELLEKEVSDLKNVMLKTRADTENYKKRLQRDHDLSQKYKIQKFALDILPVMDNLERALKEETSDNGLKDGVQMIYNQLKASLEVEGVKVIEALNCDFDPNKHQAMLTEKVDGVEKNIVIEELQKGYMLKDRILRPSLVKVSE